MRSVYAKILGWCCCTLVFCFLGFSAILRFGIGAANPFARQHQIVLAEASDAYLDGGSQQLRAYFEQLRKYVADDYFLTDARGRDLVSGEDRSLQISAAGSNFAGPRHVGGKLIMVTPSADGKYLLISLLSPPGNASSILPYGLLMLSAVALLCWALAAHIASPLRRLARTVKRFGDGDLAARVSVSQDDEIGDLAKDFDRMAEHIQALLIAERQLLQDVSHELRSPLARLTIAAELVRTSQDRDQAVSQLHSEIDRLSDLVSALLDVNRTENDPASHRLERLFIDRLIEEIIEGCRIEAEAKGCEIRFRLARRVAVDANRELLRRAVENVLTNAIRFGPPKTTIDVDLKIEDGVAIVGVRDYGSGVPESLLPKIFNPFFRVDSSRNSDTGGLGLGLAIAQRAISLHHGDLRAENVLPGLRVWLKVPLARS